MPQVADAGRIREVLRGLAGAVKTPANVFLSGGATAVLLGWRSTSVDVDLTFLPDQDGIHRVLRDLKQRLDVNIELASPTDVIPVPPGWDERGIFEVQNDPLTFYHFDPYAQALARLERGRPQDTDDVQEMVQRKIIVGAKALEYFRQIEPLLYRFPAIHEPSFRQSVETFFRAGST